MPGGLSGTGMQRAAAILIVGCALTILVCTALAASPKKAPSAPGSPVGASNDQGAVGTGRALNITVYAAACLVLVLGSVLAYSCKSGKSAQALSSEADSGGGDGL